MKNIIRSFVVFALVFGILSVPALTFAKNNKNENKRSESKSENSKEKCRAWGHFIAPGLFKKGTEKRDISDCQKIPFGIWKKINNDQNNNDEDKNAPRIFSLSSRNITETTAEIVVFTSEKAIISVEYGPTTAYGQKTPKTADFKAFNVVDLTGLTKDTNYHYRVIVEDKSGNSHTSTDRMFKTKDTTDATAPIISDITVTNISDTSVVVAWKTNENTNMKIEYGMTNSYGTTVENSDMLAMHSRVLTGLTANTTYHYKITAKDSSDNSTSTEDKTFTTLTTDTIAPIISDISLISLTQTSATVSWKTNENTKSTIFWSTVSPINEATAFKNIDNELKMDNSYKMESLSSDTTYYFKITSSDASSNSTSSETGSFTTLE